MSFLGGWRWLLPGLTLTAASGMTALRVRTLWKSFRLGEDELVKRFLDGFKR